MKYTTILRETTKRFETENLPVLPGHKTVEHFQIKKICKRGRQRTFADLNEYLNSSSLMQISIIKIVFV